MEAILLKPRDIEEFQLLKNLLTKMKVSSKVLTEEELEDIGLGMLMKEVDRTKTTSRGIIFKKLKGK